MRAYPRRSRTRFVVPDNSPTNLWFVMKSPTTGHSPGDPEQAGSPSPTDHPSTPSQLHTTAISISVWRGKLNRSSGSVVTTASLHGNGKVEVSMELASRLRPRFDRAGRRLQPREQALPARSAFIAALERAGGSVRERASWRDAAVNDHQCASGGVPRSLSKRGSRSGCRRPQAMILGLNGATMASRWTWPSASRRGGGDVSDAA